MQIRLFPTAEVNENWKVKARFTATLDARLDQTGDAQLTYIYAEGKYDKFTANIGRMPLFTDVDGGIVADDFFSGLQLTFGDTLKAKLNAGRWKNGFNDPMDYAGLELLYNDKKNFNIGAGYHHFSSDDFTTRNGYSKTGDEDKAGIVTVGAGYKFGGGVKLVAAYAQNTKADEYDKGYNFELNYLGADRKKAGSWGAFIAYRYVGSNVGLATTFDSYNRRSNKKGVDFGFTWSPLKNTLTKISYFHGKTLDTRENDRTFFGRVSFFF